MGCEIMFNVGDYVKVEGNWHDKYGIVTRIDENNNYFYLTLSRNQ